MVWSGQQNFSVAPMLPFQINDKEAGLLKSYGPLSFLKVSI
jgi:serine carboxypeptidase-like clade IV